ncbi:MAG: FecR family protein [Candidatus Binatia bacterium]|nr:FecR family protein [Candidatus Binatia bacterium]
MSRPGVGTFITLVFFCCGVAHASMSEVGTIAAVSGEVHIDRSGQQIPAAIGNPVAVGDILVTGTDGKLRVVFQDDSVLILAENSRVTVDENVFDAGAGEARSLFGLLRGKVNAAVSEYYRRRGNAYEIRTETAVAGVRGTEFAVRFDPAAQLTEVIGIEGSVQVHSLRDPQAPGVLVTAHEVTLVEEDRPPTRPRRLDEPLLRERIEGFDFISRGRPEGLVQTASLASGAAVARLSSEKVVTAGVAPGAEPSKPVNPGTEGDATGKLGQPPAAIRLTGQLGLNLGE